MAQTVLRLNDSRSPGATVRLVSDADGSVVGLFDQFLAGSNEAGLALHGLFNRRMVIYCTKIVGDRETARDLVQEMWERMVRLRGRRDHIDNPAGLIVTTARNLCLDYLKSPRRHVARLDSVPERAEEDHVTTDVEAALVDALDALPIDQREILVLHLYCGYQYDEIAGMLGRTAGAVWAQAYRARVRLRRIVADRFPSTLDTTAEAQQ